MYKKYFLPFILALVINPVFLSAQDEEEEEIDPQTKDCPMPDNKKAIKLYEKGIDRKKYKDNERFVFLKEALALEPDFAMALLKQTQMMVTKAKLDSKKSFEPLEPTFKKIYQLCPRLHADPLYYLGFIAFEKGNWKESMDYLKKFREFKSDNEKKFANDYPFQMKQAQQMILFAQKYEELAAITVPYDLKMVKGVSSEQDEYLPYISPDDNILLYTRTGPQNARGGVFASETEAEYFMISKKQSDGNFDAGKQMPAPFNRNGNEGSPSLTIDNQTLYYAIAKMEGGAQPNTDIYVTTKNASGYNDPRKVENINDPKYWDSQPTVSADGYTMYFVSDRPGGIGGTDIYKSVRDKVTGQWGEPMNLGARINSPADERCPFLHSDSETLYFSSDGWTGYGCTDIFYAKKGAKGEWTKPKNIGAPINTAEDNDGFYVSTDGKTAYVCTDKFAGEKMGRHDLYKFELYPEARPQEVAFVKGEIKTLEGKPLTGNAVVELKNTKTQEKTFAHVDTTTGKYLIAVNVAKKEDLTITVKKEGIAFNTQTISVKDAAYGKPAVTVAPIVVEKAEVGKSFVINNIYYKTNSADLSPESFPILDEFAAYLKENPNLKIEIQGHTDNVGNGDANMALSTNRSFTVRNYLEEKGIPAKRLAARGFGSTKPKVPNTNDENKAKNRRTEFMIMH